MTVFTDHRSLPHADASGAERAKHAASDQTLILRTVGVLSDAVVQQIEACLKTVMEIP